MPLWLTNLVSNSTAGGIGCTTSNLVQIIGKLSSLDPKVKKVVLCHDAVQHVTRFPNEGHHFCGYRNIQMLMSYLNSTNPVCIERFGNSMPSILELQALIEKAWDRGINERGRIETGGISGTRKHIGTLEVCYASPLCPQSTFNLIPASARPRHCCVVSISAAEPISSKALFARRKLSNHFLTLWKRISPLTTLHLQNLRS